LIENNISDSNGDSHQVQVAAGAVALDGVLSIPSNAHGVVLLAQGSRNIENIDYYGAMADALHEAAMATLYVPLLTEDEESLDKETQFFRFNISILHQRIIGIAGWLINTLETQKLAIGYFGTGVTGAAALVAAAVRPDPVHAIVAGSARTDLAQPYLGRMLAPTCLIVGESDSAILHMNREALAQIPAKVEASKKLESIAGAVGLFDAPEGIQKVARLVGQWFARYLEPIV